MAQVVELARFTVKEGAEEQMLAERPGMVTAMRRRYPTHLDAYLCRADDGSWVDVVLWSDESDAVAAAEGVYAYPEIATWFRHTDAVLGFEYLEVAHTAKSP